MNLDRYSYFALARDEDGRFDKGPTTQRPFTMALRWHPGVYADDERADLLDTGWRHLRRLAEGDEISARHLQMGIEALVFTRDLYEDLDTEPYPGRNAEALADINELLNELHGAVQEATL